MLPLLRIPFNHPVIKGVNCASGRGHGIKMNVQLGYRTEAGNASGVPQMLPIKTQLRL